MKKRRMFLVLGLAITACLMVVNESRAEKIAWQTVPGQAQASAQQSDRPLLVYIGASYCGYCKKLEKKTWANKTVARMVTDRFVPLKVDGQRNAEIARQLNVRAFPTVVVLSADGHVLARQAGYVDARAMTSFLTRTTDSTARSTSFKK